MAIRTVGGAPTEHPRRGIAGTVSGPASLSDRPLLQWIQLKQTDGTLFSKTRELTIRRTYGPIVAKVP